MSTISTISSTSRSHGLSHHSAALTSFSLPSPHPPATSNAPSLQATDIPLTSASQTPVDAIFNNLNKFYDDQILLGFAVYREKPKPSSILLTNQLKSSGVRFQYFSSQNERYTHNFGNKLGLFVGFNHFISLRPPIHEDEFDDVFTTRSRIPRGVHHIRRHLQHIDDVPLLVSLFSDANDQFVADYYRIALENGESIISMRSMFGYDQTVASTLATSSIALCPESFQHCHASAHINNFHNTIRPYDILKHDYNYIYQYILNQNEWCKNDKISKITLPIEHYDDIYTPHSENPSLTELIHKNREILYYFENFKDQRNVKNDPPTSISDCTPQCLSEQQEMAKLDSIYHSLELKSFFSISDQIKHQINVQIYLSYCHNLAMAEKAREDSSSPIASAELLIDINNPKELRSLLLPTHSPQDHLAGLHAAVREATPSYETYLAILFSTLNSTLLTSSSWNLNDVPTLLATSRIVSQVTADVLYFYILSLLILLCANFVLFLLDLPLIIGGAGQHVTPLSTLLFFITLFLILPTYCLMVYISRMFYATTSQLTHFYSMNTLKPSIDSLHIDGAILRVLNALNQTMPDPNNNKQQMILNDKIQFVLYLQQNENNFDNLIINGNIINRRDTLNHHPNGTNNNNNHNALDLFKNEFNPTTGLNTSKHPQHIQNIAKNHHNNNTVNYMQHFNNQFENQQRSQATILRQIPTNKQIDQDGLIKLFFKRYKNHIIYNIVLFTLFSLCLSILLGYFLHFEISISNIPTNFDLFVPVNKHPSLDNYNPTNYLVNLFQNDPLNPTPKLNTIILPLYSTFFYLSAVTAPFYITFTNTITNTLHRIALPYFIQIFPHYNISHNLSSMLLKNTLFSFYIIYLSYLSFTFISNNHPTDVLSAIAMTWKLQTLLWSEKFKFWAKLHTTYRRVAASDDLTTGQTEQVNHALLVILTKIILLDEVRLQREEYLTFCRRVDRTAKQLFLQKQLEKEDAARERRLTSHRAHHPQNVMDNAHSHRSSSKHHKKSSKSSKKHKNHHLHKPRRIQPIPQATLQDTPDEVMQTQLIMQHRIKRRRILKRLNRYNLTAAGGRRKRIFAPPNDIVDLATLQHHAMSTTNPQLQLFLMTLRDSLRQKMAGLTYAHFAEDGDDNSTNNTLRVKKDTMNQYPTKAYQLRHLDDKLLQLTAAEHALFALHQSFQLYKQQNKLCCDQLEFALGVYRIYTNLYRPWFYLHCITLACLGLFLFFSFSIIPANVSPWLDYSQIVQNQPRLDVATLCIFIIVPIAAMVLLCPAVLWINYFCTQQIAKQVVSSNINAFFQFDTTLGMFSPVGV